MNLPFKNLTYGSDTDGNSSASTNSIYPSPYKLLLLSVDARTNISVDTNTPTVTGCGLTWVEVATILYDTTSASRKRLTLFRAMGANPTQGSIAIDFGGQNQTDIDWSLNEVSGVDISGINGSGAIVQSATAKDETLTSNSLTVTLGAFSDINNSTYGMISCDGSNRTPTAGSGFIELSRYVGIRMNSIAQFKNSNDTTVDAVFSEAPNAILGGIAVEIKAAGIVYDATSVGNDSVDPSGITFAHTVADQLNRILVVGVSAESDTGGHTAQTVQSVTYAGISLQRVRTDYVTDNGTELWYLVAPATGANNVVVTMTGVVDGLLAAAMSFYGVDQYNPIQAHTGTTNTGLSITKDLTTKFLDAMIVNIMQNQSSGVVLTGDVNQTERFNAATTGDFKSAGGTRLVNSVGVYNTTWSSDLSDAMTLSILALKPVAIPSQLMQIGVG